jgi:hypothetical protein
MVLHCIPRVKRMRQSKNSLSVDRASVRPSYIFQYQYIELAGTSRYQLTYDPVLDGDDEFETEIATYTKTTSEEWNQVTTEDGDGNGRPIDPIECTVDEVFSVKITDEEVEQLKDEKGEIRYEKVFQWGFPRFGEDDDGSLFEFQAARMRNYMQKRVVEEGFKPRYYTGDKVIIGSHVARYYGACLCRMNNGGRSIDQIFSTREIMDAVTSIQAAMTKGALEDLTTCLHYSNDWDPKHNGV